MCKKVRANDYLCEKINTQMLMKHIRMPLFVWFSIVLLIAVAPISLSAQESFIQKIEKNKKVRVKNYFAGKLTSFFFGIQ